MARNWKQLELMFLNLSWSDIFLIIRNRLYFCSRNIMEQIRKENLIAWCIVLICNITDDHFSSLDISIAERYFLYCKVIFPFYKCIMGRRYFEIVKYSVPLIINLSYQHVLVDSYFVGWVIISYYYFDAQIICSLISGSPFKLASLSL